jgi:hypothetical protein
MRCYVLLLNLIVMVTSFSTRCDELDSMIELRVHCQDGSPCHFKGDRIPVVLELFNAGQEAVALPLESYRRRGPGVILVDNRSGRENRLRLGPPMSKLLTRLRSWRLEIPSRFPGEIQLIRSSDSHCGLWISQPPFLST